MPLDVVVEFKRGVYEMALSELARYVPRQDGRSDGRGDHRNRYLRSGYRPRDAAQAVAAKPTAAVDLPPGATFDPDPQSAWREAPKD